MRIKTSKPPPINMSLPPVVVVYPACRTMQAASILQATYGIDHLPTARERAPRRGLLRLPEVRYRRFPDPFFCNGRAARRWFATEPTYPDATAMVRW
jgi:hypothetical protein